MRNDRAAEDVAGGVGPPQPPTVLVADDEADLVWVIRFNLEMEGYRTLVAPNGRAALDIIRLSHPDVMLLDLMMPVMDGWAVLEEIRREGWDRPKVIIVSARTAAADRARAEGYRVDAFIPKPFEVDELLESVRALVPRPGTPAA